MSDSRQFASTVHCPETEILGDDFIGKSLGKYRLVRRLGRGGVGIVYEAIDPILDRPVAIKVLRDGIAAQPDTVRKFLREARTAARLNHPHVVHVYEADNEKGVVYLVMELMEGGSAHDRIQQWGPFPWDEATRVMLDACKGLAAVHAAGLIHRDVKPSNVMRAGDGKVKLADFGLAASIEPSTSDSMPKAQVVGTPLYMSPEQCEGRPLDPRSDIYALGATYYHLLTGRPPFEGGSAMEIMQGHCSRPAPDPRQADQRIAGDCASLVRRMLAKNPDDRPRDVLDVIRTLESILRPAASSEDTPLNWAPAADTSDQMTPVSGVGTTRVEAIEPIRTVEPRRPRTRFWLVGLCFAMMGAAFAIGRHFSHSELPPPVGKPVTITEHPQRGLDDPYPGRVVIDTNGPVTSIAFHGTDYTQIAWGTALGEQRIVSWRTRDERPPLEAGGEGVPACRQVCYWAEERSWVFLADSKIRIVPASARDKASEPKAIGVRDAVAFALHPTLNSLAFAVVDRGDPESGRLYWRRHDRGEQSLKVVPFGGKDRIPIRCLAFSGNGRYLLCGYRDGIVNRRLVDTAESSGSLQLGHQSINAVAPIDAKRFAVSTEDQIAIIDVDEMQKVKLPNDGSFREHAGKVTALSSRPEVKLLACACEQGIFVYNSGDGSLVKRFAPPGGEVAALAFDPDGTLLASGSSDGKIIIWPLQ